MKDSDRFKLYFGPYKTPRFKYGKKVWCEYRGWVKIIGLSDDKIPWPIGRPMTPKPGRDATVTKAVEASLGQPKYHFRLSWFAQLQSDGSVRINGDSQAIMEQEIAYAAAAGLNYWAVVDYWDEAPGMSIALNRYLAAKDKQGIRYCLVEEGHRLDRIGSAGWKRLVERFQRPDYARGGSYSMTQPTYAEQCALVRRDRWEKCRALRIPSVTFASAGWDTRPRNERPPPCVTWVTATPDTTPPARQQPLVDAVTATPRELAAHIREALDWTKTNRDINPSNAIIIYGWNEHDEGGWLIPTLGAGGVANEDRIKALGKVLRASTPAPVPGNRFYVD